FPRSIFHFRQWKTNNASINSSRGLPKVLEFCFHGGFSGAHLNPARTFGPALINGDWAYHWIYWVGPILAGIVGGFVYKFLLQKQIRSTEEGTNGVVTPIDKT
ncbi:unnamed protein product, partial [Callosobruchus maculatus]